jgi:hypothetical protein
MFGLVPRIEAWIDKDAKKYHLRMALPGVDPNKVDLKLQGNMLTISAESKASREAKDVDYLYREIAALNSYHRFSGDEVELLDFLSCLWRERSNPSLNIRNRGRVFVHAPPKPRHP